jgi:hypothetical protein
MPASSIAPPTSGPSGTARPEAPAQIAMARPRSPSSNALVMIARVDGRMAAAPTPITARMTISSVGAVAYAATAEAPPKSTSPPASTRRRPKRSPTAPKGRSSAANTSV